MFFDLTENKIFSWQNDITETAFRLRKGGDGLRKYNYFDDDTEDIHSLLNAFDAPRDVKKDEIEKSLKEIEIAHSEAARKEQADSKKHIEINKEEVFDTIKAFSKKSGEKIAAVAHTVKEKTVNNVNSNVNVDDKENSFSDKKKRNVTIILIFVFILVFALLVITTLHSVKAENERIAKFNTDAGKVCSQYIKKYGNCSYENLYSAYGVTGYRMNGLCFAREVDFDNDNISELFLCYDDGGVYYTEVWGYNNDKEFINFYHGESTQTNKKSDAWITVYAKNNKYYIGVHSGDKLEKVDLLALKGTEFEKKYYADYDADAQAFSIKKKVDPTSFERIKLAVLVEEKAIVNADQVSKTVESFIGSKGLSNLLTSAQSIQSAYYSVVDEYNQTYGKAKLVKKNGIAYIDGLAAVDLVDFNGDDQDELVMVYRKAVKTRGSDAQGNYVAQIEDKYYIEVYRYNGNKAILVYKNENISNSIGDSSDMYYIIKKKNNKAYYCVNSFSSHEYGRVINATSTVFKYDGTKFLQQSEAAYRTRYGYTTYFINDSEVYKSTFDEKGYSVPLFNGSSSYDENIYTVNFLQRKQLKADKLDKRVDETVSTIKKLNSSYSGDTE